MWLLCKLGSWNLQVCELWVKLQVDSWGKLGKNAHCISSNRNCRLGILDLEQAARRLTTRSWHYSFPCSELNWHGSLTIKLFACLRKHLFLTSSSQMLVAPLPSTPGLDTRWMAHPEHSGYSHLSYISTPRQARRDTKFQSMVSIFLRPEYKGFKWQMRKW